MEASRWSAGPLSLPPRFRSCGLLEDPVAGTVRAAFAFSARSPIPPTRSYLAILRSLRALVPGDPRRPLGRNRSSTAPDDDRTIAGPCRTSVIAAKLQRPATIGTAPTDVSC